MKHFANINIDRLEITYTTSNEVKQYLSSLNVGESLTIGESKEMTITRFEHPNYCCAFEIRGKDVDEKEQIYDRCICTLKFGTFNRHRQDVYIVYENDILYDTFMLGARFYIESALSLNFRRVSKLDIAYDFNYNAINKFYRMYKNEQYDLYINGRKVQTIEENVRNVTHIVGSSSRKRTFTHHTPLIKAEDGALGMAAYNKSEEIEKSGKQYIQEDCGFNRMYRFEVRCGSYKILKTTLSRLGINDEELYCKLQMKEVQAELFTDMLERLIYFRYKRKKIDLISELLK